MKLGDLGGLLSLTLAEKKVAAGGSRSGLSGIGG